MKAKEIVLRVCLFFSCPAGTWAATMAPYAYMRIQNGLPPNWVIYSGSAAAGLCLLCLLGILLLWD